MDEENPAVSSDEDDDDEDSEPVGEDSNLISAFASAEADLFRPGSNNWVVSGQHTVTGKPLLSNDMHLDHQMPNLWFAAHLKSTGFEAAGVTLPGMPVVIVGHNQRIGWGFTNVGDGRRCVHRGIQRSRPVQNARGWRDSQHRQEVIHVRGKPDVTLDVVTTRHGPSSRTWCREKHANALRWTLYDGDTSFFDVNSAQGGMNSGRPSLISLPRTECRYADVDGHIGYQATGKFRSAHRAMAVFRSGQRRRP
jgi:penicillin amidase